ncbi:MAG: chemotaxis protein CheB [Bacteroidota bacterium]|jgi:two-component system chemotaxis response regulator CheB|nr:chemotaxis protein CheB [Bacteroidota bacterium]
MVRVFAIAFTPGWAGTVTRLLERRADVRLVHTAFGDDGTMALLKSHASDIVAIEGSTHWEAVRDITQRIMREQPMPVVILTSVNNAHGVDNAHGIDHCGASLDAGALTLITIPDDRSEEARTATAEQLAKTLHLMAEVKVVRRWDGSRLEALSRAQQELAASGRHRHAVDVVCIGASAGGTKALQQVFSQLPASFPLPILVVQHISSGYVGGLVRWLGEQTALHVCVAEDGMALESGTIHIAPDERHLTVDEKHCILLSDDEPVNGFKPSIARLFGSIHHAYGGNAVAVLLSGMGSDGAMEMRTLHDAGAITIAQDKDTSLIHGIPGEAIKLAAVTSVLPVQHIGAALFAIANRWRNSSGPDAVSDITKTDP